MNFKKPLSLILFSFLFFYSGVFSVFSCGCPMVGDDSNKDFFRQKVTINYNNADLVF